MNTTSVHRTSAFARAFPRWDARAGWIVGLVALGALAMALMPRLAQPASFHNFADRRALLGVPNFMDVVSNAPFAMASALGMKSDTTASAATSDTMVRIRRRTGQGRSSR